MSETENTPDTEAEAAAATDDESAGSAAPDAAADDKPTRAGSSLAATASSPAEKAPPAEVVPPKERRARARAAKAAKVPKRGPRTAEERQAERTARRAAKATERRTGRVRSRAKARAAESTGAVTPPRERAPGVQKVRQGIVVSDKADKTITVRIDVSRRHRRYDKIVRTSNTLHAHDESNDAHIGDTVVVREARPLSRTKRWRLVQIVERAK
jgi:small subunit ribosomal protein S17